MFTVNENVFVPDKREKKVSCAATRRHRFLKKGIPARLRVQAFDGQVFRANEEFTLEIGGETKKGVTDEEGIIDVSVPAGATEGTLYLGPDQDAYDVQVGQLPPVDMVKGIKSRMLNLGFFGGEVNDELDDEAREALADFQQHFGLEVTGEPDQATQDKVIRLHDDFCDWEKEVPKEADEFGEGFSGEEGSQSSV